MDETTTVENVEEVLETEMPATEAPEEETPAAE